MDIELKFKAWDKKRKVFIPQEDFAISAKGKLLIGFDHIDGEYDPFFAPYDMQIDYKGFKPSCKTRDEDVEITQYTGRKDKNGNKIYK